ncbi:MAG: TonB family protein [Nannocystaceae bacterium]|nr:TonB family protein [Nannocystaceae bacterium]
MTDDERASLDDALLPRPWLEEWTVPDVPSDLSSRVLSRMREGVVIQPPVVIADRRSSALVTGAAVFAAAAAAAALVITLVRPGPAGSGEAPASAIATAPETSAPQPGPIVVAGDEVLERVGHLVIDVRPHDASVTIDGRAVAGPSPFVAANLPAGTHEIEVTREGFRPWRKTLDVPAAELQLPIALVVDDAPASAPAATPTPTPTAKPARVAARKPDGPEVPTSLRSEIVGDIDRNVIRQVVRKHIGEIRECYNEGLLRKPELRGRVSVSFVIDGRGDASDATLVDSTLGDATVEACIVRAVDRWKFPAPPPGAGTVKITYPFLLEPG